MSKGVSLSNRHRTGLFEHNVRKFLFEFPDLKYDGGQIVCLVCNRGLLAYRKHLCVKHINSARHKRNKYGQTRYSQFIFDLIVMLCSCNVPLFILDKEPFRVFWKKYNPTLKLPSRRTLQRYVPSVREKLENDIKSKIHNKKLWLVVDEKRDSKKHSVANVIVRTLDPFRPSSAYLLASKRLAKVTDETVQQLILSTLKKWELSTHNVLLFLSNSASVMLSAGHNLKVICPNLLHITCILQAFHLTEEMIRRCYPDVDALITHTKDIFLKSPKHIREFYKQCPGLRVPSQPIPTQWGSWLNASFYYFKNFEMVKSFVLQLDPKGSPAIKESQVKFQDARVQEDLRTIHNNYVDLASAINKLQNTSLSLSESLQIVDHMQRVLETLNDEKCVRVRETFDNVIRRNPDFFRLRNIHCNTAEADPLSNLRDYFNYANITSVDVERSFSLCKDIFSPQRTNLSETTLETFTMLRMWKRVNVDF